MQIINATKGVKRRMLNILLDGGSSMRIMPGEISGVLVPSVNTIKAVINSGDPDEIGIIFGGSWEESIGRQVTGGFPYYYTNLEEAKRKLFTEEATSPTTDANVHVATDNSEVIANMQTKIDELTKQIEGYQSAEANWKLDAMKLEKAEGQVKEYEIKVKELQSENGGLQSNLKSYQAKVQELEAYKNKSLEDTKLINEQLEEAQTKIDQMRETFNGVCDQFGIKFDSEKGWYKE